jgi:hypothetical protein
MTTRDKFRSFVRYEYDGTTFETVGGGAPFQFFDDFAGAGPTAGIPAAGSPAAGYPWVKKIVGAAPPTVAAVSNAAGGQVACALTSASQAQEASLYFNDSLSIDTSKFGMAEWRAKLSAAPSGAGAQAFLGVGSAWVGGPTSLAEYAGFLWDGSAALKFAWNDGGSNTGATAAALTTDTAGFHVYAVNWDNPADIVFTVDGNRVNPFGSVAWAPGASSVMQLWSTVYKAAGTVVATLTVDKIAAFNTR